ncbi:BTB domain-containing protein [Mycena indigotica]|uniref:BTB domain-containing protein n=1 Tax=Mycena indigotica TaxID=2126181 RepID=A0A8H6TCI4_9AGAR|nr:BTB domain-containing protein [Mycena indigotica]KAF7314955.1 BTB domain-containing protein [Mycena indigotica]
MDVDSEQTEPRHIEELWFEDGNIVVQAGFAQYKVFHGMLARHSDVFRDMLSFPQPHESELVEGCPLVRLPDSEVEVTPFLKAMFIPTFLEPYPATTDFMTIYGCLRLSNKYQVHFLRRRALIHFASRYRTTLTEYDALRVSGNELAPGTASWKIPYSDNERDASWVVCSFSLARELDVLWVLPRIFYVLSSPQLRVFPNLFHGVDYEGLHCSLNFDDQCRLLEGREANFEQMPKVLGFLHSKGCDLAESSGHDSELRRTLVQEVMLNASNYPRNLLNVWAHEDWCMFTDPSEPWCQECVTKFESQHVLAREAFWNQLPEMFGLPKWKELEAMRIAAIGNVFEV